ncbi:GNAT family N-acetyltransferase [Zavarzinia compransoris]|nr:GNAT family N-acetyltransferase [Zavarzinia marina]
MSVLDDSIRLRDGGSGDAPALAALFRASVHGAAAGHYDAGQREAWAPADLDVAAFAARIGRCRIIVAERAGRPAGFATLAPGGLVDMLFVDPDFLRLGIGRRLLRAVEDAARLAGDGRLESHVSLTARPLFEAAGFRVDAEQSVELRGRRFTNFRMSKRL